MLRLYVTGNSPKSLQARTNLEAICREPFARDWQVEIIDVLDDPLRLLADAIAVTPALVKVAPPPEVRMLGDLSDRARVVLALTHEKA